MLKENLEKQFERTVSMPAGSCPLPDAGRGSPVIEHPGLLSVEKQPKDYNYDIEENEAEETEFKKRVLKALEAGEITQGEADLLEVFVGQPSSPPEL